MLRASSVTSTIAALLLACQPGAETPEAKPAAEPALHELQFFGSHNSYKEAIDPSLFQLFAGRDERSAEIARSLEYEHPSLREQLESGQRILELDVFHDPEGGRFAEPLGIQQVADAGLDPGPAFDPEGVMHQPGYKVLHVQDLDFRSNCLTLQLCLAELLAWSEANPDHLPVVVTVNAKDQKIDGLADPLPFDAAAWEALDAEVLAGLGADRLLTPDDVRADGSTLEETVLASGWPRLDAARGRFLWVLDERGAKRDSYIDGHPSLEGRVFFVNAEPGTPEAAFRILNDPIGGGDQIREAVRAGYLVRTRADADTREARTGDTTRRDAAFASGAHYISTDYAFGSPFGTDYRVELPGGGAVRCNPVTAEPNCEVPARR